MGATAMQVNYYNSNHLPVVAHFCNRLKIEKIANQILPWDPTQWQLSPGTVIKALIIDALNGRTPLYRMDEFFATVDIDSLLGSGIKAEQLNDDRLGRTLDCIFRYGPAQLFSTIALSALKEFAVTLNSIHGDTTSKNVFGKYARQNPKSILICNGYSKDKRPDLKQFLFGVVTTREKIPICGTVSNGNIHDKNWNNRLLKTIKDNLRMTDFSNITYIADSAVVCEMNLIEIGQLFMDLISRLPENFALCHQLMERSFDDSGWESIGRLSTRTDSANYKLKSYQEMLYGRVYRFIVVHSDKHNQRKLKTLNRKVQAEQKRLLNLNQKPALFHCEKDAQVTLDNVQKSIKFWNVSGQIQSVAFKKKTGKRGRRRRNEPVEYDTFYQIVYQMTENHDQIEKEKQKAGMFVLITTHLERFSNKEILVEYKEQSSVESSFKFLKSPMIAEQVFLKNNSRIEALGYLMLVALMIWTLIERQLRNNITTPLIGPGKISMLQPTAWAIMMMLDSIKVKINPHPFGCERSLLRPLTENELLCLFFLGITVKKYLFVGT